MVNKKGEGLVYAQAIGFGEDDNLVMHIGGSNGCLKS